MGAGFEYVVDPRFRYLETEEGIFPVEKEGDAGFLQRALVKAGYLNANEVANKNKKWLVDYIKHHKYGIRTNYVDVKKVNDPTEELDPSSTAWKIQQLVPLGIPEHELREKNDDVLNGLLKRNNIALPANYAQKFKVKRSVKIRPTSPVEYEELPKKSSDDILDELDAAAKEIVIPGVVRTAAPIESDDETEAVAGPSGTKESGDETVVSESESEEAENEELEKQELEKQELEKQELEKQELEKQELEKQQESDDESATPDPEPVIVTPKKRGRPKKAMGPVTPERKTTESPAKSPVKLIKSPRKTFDPCGLYHGKKLVEISANELLSILVDLHEKGINWKNDSKSGIYRGKARIPVPAEEIISLLFDLLTTE